MAIPGFTGTRVLPLVRSTINRPIYAPLDYGPGIIESTVKKKGDPANIPVRRLVRCIRERDGKTVAETWSNAVTGAYQFTQLVMEERYTVIAYDYEHGFRAAVADNITPTLP